MLMKKLQSLLFMMIFGLLGLGLLAGSPAGREPAVLIAVLAAFALLLPVVRKSLMRVVVAVFGLMFFMHALVALLAYVADGAGPLSALLIIPLLSVGAYFLRESRLRRRRAERVRAVERTPVLPHQAIER